MDLSGVFAGTFNALKQRFGLLILISLLPAIATTIFAVIIVILALALGIGVVADPRSSIPLIATLILVGIAGGVAIMLAYLKAQGMTMVAAYEIAQGQHPDFGGVWRRTKGFLPRMAAVIAIFAGVAILLYGLILALAFSMASALNGRSGGAAAGAVVLFVLLILALIPISIFLNTKLLYTVPAIAIEQTDGIDGLKRSWSLTRGAFWRTFGYYFVASLAVGVIGYVVSMITQLPLMGIQVDRYDDPRQALANLTVALPLYLVMLGVQTLLQLITQPFLYTYVAYMFVDQVRRTELPPAGAYGGYGQPGPQGGYYAAPNQYYGQPGQPYPPQPGYGQPGQGYQPPQPPQPGQPQQPGTWQPPTTPQPPQG